MHATFFCYIILFTLILGYIILSHVKSFNLISEMNNSNFTSASPLRWGIVSAGLICNDFVIAMSTLNSSEHVAAAIAARNIQDAEKFAKEHGIKKWYGSYKELFQDPDIGEIFSFSMRLECLKTHPLFIRILFAGLGMQHKSLEEAETYT